MRKKLLSILSAVTLTTLLFAGCGGSNSTSNNSDVKIGMVTNTGTIDDRSFNQGTWEGIKRSQEELGTDIKYLKPVSETEDGYLKEFANLYDAGYKFMITPGYKFESAVYKAQDKYSDAKFVLIDGAPNDGNGNYKVGENTVSVTFAEHQAGFLAGVAASLELKEGKIGFIGGMETNSVQKFNWGYQQGIAYANEHLGTNMTINPEDVVYEGSFDNVAGGTQLAAQMYDRGVKAIFTAAGDVGNGVITEAKNRINNGEESWFIGVDSDQYEDGLYGDNKSVVLTSAIKRLDNVSFDMIKQFIEGNFPGGQSLVFDASNDGVGIPAENPNLSDETQKTVNEVFEKIKNGEIEVSSERGNLIR